MPITLKKNTPKFNYLLVFFVLSTSIFSYSQSYKLDESELSKRVYLDANTLSVFEDSSESLSFSEISAANFQSNFISKNKKQTYTNNSNIWLKFTIENTSNRRRDFVLLSNDWDVQFFSSDINTHFFKERQGVLLNNYNSKFYSGDIMDSKIADYLLPGASRTYYAKMPGLLSNVSFKTFDFIAIIDKSVIDKKGLLDLWSISIYVGILSLILLANFYLLFISFKWSTVFYGIYCITYVFFFTGYYQVPGLFSYKLPITHSIFLPLTAALYLLFIITYLSLDKHNKLVSTIFKGYIILVLTAFVILLYLQATDMAAYYKILPIVNISNLAALIVSSIIIIRIPGKLKYFIFLGVSFIVLSSLFTWSIQYDDNQEQTFLISIAGNALEMIAFLFGILYLHKQEQLAAEVKLVTAHKELEFKKKELENFYNSIKEKNKLIEQFEKQIEKSEGTTEQKQKNLQQLTKSIILTEDDWEDFKKLYEEVHPNFFFNLKQNHSQLTNAEIRLITLMKLNLSNKEIAGMLGISPDSAIKTKYRLNKKLSNTKKSDLEAIIQTL